MDFETITYRVEESVAHLTLSRPARTNALNARMLDEKLGMHIAFGRSEHFGGQVGPDAFTKPEAVIHIDRVYVPEMQPDIGVKMVDIALEEGTILPLMRNGEYVVDFA